MKLLGLGTPTPLYPGQTCGTAEGVVTSIQHVRRILNAAGRSSEDPRCVWHLWQHETGCGRACWWNNWGNVKARHWCFADAAMIASGKAYSTSRYANGFWLARGNQETHVEAYLAFPDAVTWARFERAFLGSSYPAVIRGYELGGREGLARAAIGLARGGYSPGTEATRITRAYRWWDAQQRLVGASTWASLGHEAAPSFSPATYDAVPG